MQIGEILAGSGGTVYGFDIGRELYQITGHKTRRQTEMAQNLHQQPAGIPAGARSQLECFVRRLHAGFHAHQVTNVALQLLIDQHQKIDDVAAGDITTGAKTIEPSLQQGAGCFLLQIGRKLGRKLSRICKGEYFRVGLDKKIERVDHRHIGDQIHRNTEFSRSVRKHEPRYVITVSVLLPIDKVFIGNDVQRIAEDRRTAMGSGTQANFVRRYADQAVESVMGLVMERYTDCHGFLGRVMPSPAA